MECPHCGSDDTSVIDSRPAKGAIRRRRQCGGCQHRFTTYERIAELEPAVIKRDGRRESFQPGKIRHGIRLAAAKRPLPEGELDRVVESVRTLAVQTGRAEIPSATLGEWVWERLRTLDRVTAFRFAAVFRRPDDTDALRRELAAAERAAPTAAPPAPQPRLPGIAPDGASKVSAPDGASKVSAPDGASKVSAPDGASRASAPDGASRASAPDGASRANAPDEVSRANAPDEASRVSAPDEVSRVSAPDEASRVSASIDGATTAADPPPPAEATHKPPPQAARAD